MAEVLSVLAGVAQLMEYASKLFSALLKAFQTVKYGAKLLKAQSQQVTRLIDTVVALRQNEQLHTPLIAQQLQVIVTEADALLAVLHAATLACTSGPLQRRFWTALRNRHEESILQAFKRLEEEKAALLLCINLASAETLSSLYQSMSWLDDLKALKKRRRNGHKRVSSKNLAVSLWVFLTSADVQIILIDDVS